MPNDSPYDAYRKAACPDGCGKGRRVCETGSYRYHYNPVTSDIPCTAPTRDEFEAQQAKELVELRHWKEAAAIERKILRDLMVERGASPTEQLHFFVRKYIDQQAARIAELEGANGKKI